MQRTTIRGSFFIIVVCCAVGRAGAQPLPELGELRKELTAVRAHIEDSLQRAPIRHWATADMLQPLNAAAQQVNAAAAVASVDQAHARIAETLGLRPLATLLMDAAGRIVADAAGISLVLHQNVPDAMVLRVQPTPVGDGVELAAAIAGADGIESQPQKLPLRRFFQSYLVVCRRDHHGADPRAATPAGGPAGTDPRVHQKGVRGVCAPSLCAHRLEGRRAREIFDLPPEAMAKLAAFGPQTSADPRRGYTRWAFPPQGNYALYRYVQAKAMILKEPYEELVKYLDVPAFWRGDLYYIDNLCAALESRP